MSDLPHISKLVLGFFRWIVRGYFRRHFSAVRVSEAKRFSELPEGPVIVYGNHSSWWDPMVCVLLASKLMPKRRHYAPMDATALARYKILQHIGVFGVDLNAVRGAARFLRTGLEILSRGGVLWVTPQGRFVDVRERPLVFKPGLSVLAAKVGGGCTVVPLAIEYVFWDERLPEALMHFGEPIVVQSFDNESLEQRLEAGMLEAMETLKAKAMKRDAWEFAVVQRGRVGTGGFYELGQRTMARLRGRRYQREHTPASLPAVPLLGREERG